MIYLTNLNLNKNELQNAIVHKVGVLPVNPTSGQICYLTTDNKLYIYNGTEWKDVGASVVVNGDGTLTINGQTVNIAAKHFEGTKTKDETDEAAITRVVGEGTVNVGDTLVLKTLIASDKYSYMGFVYNGTKWAAMDGNVSADNVILNKDITLAGSYTQVGNVTKGSTATGTLTATGKSVAEILQSIFTKELNPTATQPSVSVTLNGAGAKEVGTKVTPTWNAALNKGAYTYGPDTGITANSWAITGGAGETANTATGSFNEITIGDTTNYKITATAEHGQGAMPKTNLGNEYAKVRIEAGSKTGSSAAFTGYRSYFYGSKATKVELNSSNIRGLTNSNKAVVANQEFQLTVVEGAKQVIIAFPKSINKTLKKVLDVGAFGTDIVASFVKSTVSVEGVGGYTAVEYDVYEYAPAAALGANTYKVTIS